MIKCISNKNYTFVGTLPSSKGQMGLLQQLWDDTVAGPPPLGKLRKYNSFSPSDSSSPTAAAAGAFQVTRSITVSCTPPSSSSAVSSPRSPSSPASAPDSPLEPTSAATGPWGDWKKLRRKQVAAASEGTGAASPRTPTVYDWFFPSLSSIRDCPNSYAPGGNQFPG